MRFDPTRPRVPALRLGGIGARATALVVPADHRRGRHAAAWQLIPSSTAASARDRRPIDNGLPIHAGLRPASTGNQISAPV